MDFTSEESTDRTTQMKVHHALKIAREVQENNNTPPPTATTISALTNKSGEVEEVMVRAPNLKLTRTNGCNDLVQLGFATTMNDGDTIYISNDHQLR